MMSLARPVDDCIQLWRRSIAGASSAIPQFNFSLHLLSIVSSVFGARRVTHGLLPGVLTSPFEQLIRARVIAQMEERSAKMVPVHGSIYILHRLFAVWELTCFICFPHPRSWAQRRPPVCNRKKQVHILSQLLNRPTSGGKCIMTASKSIATFHTRCAKFKSDHTRLMPFKISLGFSDRFSV
jgi:hypothetical protein